MHWPGSTTLLIVGLSGIAIIYTLRFLKKSIKELLDIMKWGWVITTTITSLSVSMHWLPKQSTYIPNLIMLGVTLYFGSMCLKNKELLEN